MTKHCKRTSSNAVFIALLLGLVAPHVSANDRAKTDHDRAENRVEEIDATADTIKLLSTRCLECHDADVAEGGYVMATLGQLKEAGDSGKAAVINGDAEASELFRRLVTKDSDERMPAGGPSFSPDEIEQVKRWIDSGAKTGRWGPERLLSEIVSFDSVARPAPEVYPRPIPVIGLAAGVSRLGKLEDVVGDDQAAASSPTRRATVVVGGYHELLWLSAKDNSRQRLGGFGRFIAAIRPRPQRPQMAVAHGEPGVRGLVSLVQSVVEESPGLVNVWSGNDLPGDIAFSPDGERLAIGGHDGGLSVIEIDSGETVFSSTPHADAILSVVWSPDGTQVLTASRDRTARAVRLEDGRAISNFTSHERAVFAIASGKRGIFTIDETGTLRLWAEGNKQPRMQRQLDRSSTVGMVMHDDQLYVAEPHRVIRTRVGSKEISDGKDDEGNPKTKRIPEWEDAPPLTLDSSRVITALTVAEDGTVWAGTHDGMLYAWRDGKPIEPKQVFPQ